MLSFDSFRFRNYGGTKQHCHPCYENRKRTAHQQLGANIVDISQPAHRHRRSDQHEPENSGGNGLRPQLKPRELFKDPRN